MEFGAGRLPHVPRARGRQDLSRRRSHRLPRYVSIPGPSSSGWKPNRPLFTCDIAPGTYLLSEAINKPLAVLHKPVPHFNEKLHMSVERTLKRFKPDQPFERSSWVIVDDRNLLRRASFPSHCMRVCALTYACIYASRFCHRSHHRCPGHRPECPSQGPVVPNRPPVPPQATPDECDRLRSVSVTVVPLES